MILAIASGKGGTGKTTLAAALARVWGRSCVAVDLDVEAPNLHLFLKPVIEREDTAALEVPVADTDACTGCGACRNVCAFKAIALFGDFPVVFPELCHGCGGCLAVCPTGALRAGARDLGHVLSGATEGGLRFLMGRMRIGEAQSPPLIRWVQASLDRMMAESDADVIIDAPPGTSCPALAAVRDADLVLLVTEPTPFGRHDLELAHRAIGRLGRRMAVVVNRAGVGDRAVYAYCREHGLPILAEIPFARDVAEAYASSRTLETVGPEHARLLSALVADIRLCAGIGDA